MPEYRIHKSNLPKSLPESDGLSFVRVSSNADGVTLDRIAFEDLQVVEHAATGLITRRATVITAIEPDKQNPEWFVCTTKDVILPYKEEDLSGWPESD